MDSEKGANHGEFSKKDQEMTQVNLKVSSFFEKMNWLESEVIKLPDRIDKLPLEGAEKDAVKDVLSELFHIQRFLPPEADGYWQNMQDSIYRLLGHNISESGPAEDLKSLKENFQSLKNLMHEEFPNY